MADSEKPPAWLNQNRHLQPRPTPFTYAQRLGKPTTARIPWESAPIAESGRPRRGRVEVAGAPTETSPIGVQPSNHASPGVPGATRFQASEAIASSSWTGRRSLREQVIVIQALAPFALESVDQLESAIREKRLNDPAGQDALAALKELHEVIGELIAHADSKRPMKRVWKRFEGAKEKYTDALWNGAQVILVAPALAMGTATFLSMLSGFPISEGMVTALCAASMTKDALLTVAKRR